jgi:hypothetical protein
MRIRNPASRTQDNSLSLSRGSEDSTFSTKTEKGSKSNVAAPIISGNYFCAAHIGMGGVKIKKEPCQRDEYVYRIS